MKNYKKFILEKISLKNVVYEMLAYLFSPQCVNSLDPWCVLCVTDLTDSADD